MRVALVGIGDVGRYFVEVFSQSSHDVLVLTSRKKDFLDDLNITQRVTDYSLGDLTSILDDQDAVVSTSAGPNEAYVKLHKDLLEACKRSKTCKRFIPSEWTINIEEFVDMPIYHLPLRPQLRQTFREQQDVKYTLVCNGWFADYVVPSSQRYIKNVGQGFPADHDTKVFQIYGNGKQKVSVTSVRDVARATLALLDQDPSEWREYTHFAAQTLTYNDIYELLHEQDSSWKMQQVNFTDVLAAIDTKQDLEEHQLRLVAFLGANELPEEKRVSFGDGFLKGYKGRTVQDLLREASEDKKMIL